MVHTRFNPRTVEGLRCKPPTYNPVQTQFKDMCDINNIVRRAFAGDSTVFRAARYVDVEHAPETLHEALQSQVDSRNAYEALPEAVRAKYPTPEAYFAACHNPEELKTLQELGIVETPEVETPVKVEITNPVTPEGAA